MIGPTDRQLREHTDELAQRIKKQAAANSRQSARLLRADLLHLLRQDFDPSLLPLLPPRPQGSDGSPEDELSWPGPCRYRQLLRGRFREDILHAWRQCVGKGPKAITTEANRLTNQLMLLLDGTPEAARRLSRTDLERGRKEDFVSLHDRATNLLGEHVLVTGCRNVLRGSTVHAPGDVFSMHPLEMLAESLLFAKSGPLPGPHFTVLTTARLGYIADAACKILALVGAHAKGGISQNSVIKQLTGRTGGRLRKKYGEWIRELIALGFLERVGRGRTGRLILGGGSAYTTPSR